MTGKCTSLLDLDFEWAYFSTTDPTATFMNTLEATLLSTVQDWFDESVQCTADCSQFQIDLNKETTSFSGYKAVVHARFSMSQGP